VKRSVDENLSFFGGDFSEWVVTVAMTLGKLMWRHPREMERKK